MKNASRLMIGGGLLLAARLVGAQTCNPLCAAQPAACCAQPSADTFLAEECTGQTSDTVHFVVPGTGTGWVDQRSPATFDVSGTSGTFTIGDVMPKTVGFTIGKSSGSARFQVIDTSLTIIGQCVGTGGDTYTGLPTMVSFQGRALSILKSNTLYCRFTPSGAPTEDLFCLGVKGDVGGPFQAQELCDPDRVEYICGLVM
jgi:hypothetical protein